MSLSEVQKAADALLILASSSTSLAEGVLPETGLLPAGEAAALGLGMASAGATIFIPGIGWVVILGAAGLSSLIYAILTNNPATVQSHASTNQKDPEKCKTKGSTANLAEGSWLPSNVQEIIMAGAILMNPNIGYDTGIVLNDIRWPASEGWKKMEYRVLTNAEINYVLHYNYNVLTGCVDDIKVKGNKSNPKPGGYNSDNYDFGPTL